MTKTKRRAPKGASPDPKVSARWAEMQQMREEHAAMRVELENAQRAVAAGGVDVTAHPSLAAAIRRLDQSAHDFAVAADQRTNAAQRECERLRKQVMRFAEMLGGEAVRGCHVAPDPMPGFNVGFRIRGDVVESLHGVAPHNVAAKSREVG